MPSSIRTVIYPVTDLGRAEGIFRAILGTDPIVDEPYYVQFDADGQEIGLDPNGVGKGMTGPVAYWHVSDVHATVTELLAAGAREKEAVHDVGGGRLIATVVDGDGNLIGLVQPS